MSDISSHDDSKLSAPQFMHNCATVDINPSRMLHVSRLCASLPVFPSEALRTCAGANVRFFPHEWVTLVAGTKLFLWRYVSSNVSQPHSPCLTFDLPASDLPPNALLVGLIFPTPGTANNMGTTTTNAPSPSSCVALSSFGGNLRLWPRLTRNYVHIDSVLAAPVGGLYGDEAMQMEPASLPGTFLLATRTGHLVLVDLRHAQDGITSRLITNSPDGGFHPMISNTQSLFSGIGRRVSNLFSLVTSVGSGGGPTGAGSAGRSTNEPAHGGESFVFVRLLTVPPTQTNESCTCYMLLENQLDIWTIDYNLEEQLQGVYNLDTITHSMHSNQSWRAVDMTLNSNNPNDHTAYILLTGSHRSPDNLCLVTLRIRPDTDGAAIEPCLQITASVSLDWPFAYDGQFDVQAANRNNGLQLCLPLVNSISSQAMLYPCLLACLYCVRTGQVAILEVLTGRVIGKLEFGSQLGPSQTPNPQSLVGIGNMDMHHLFIFLTSQRGILSLTPKLDNSKSKLVTLLDSMDHLASGGPTDLESSAPSTASVKSRGTSLSSVLLNNPKRRDDHALFINLDSQNRGRLRINIQFQSDQFRFTELDSPKPELVRLPSQDRAFVILCEIGRVYWMGFKEQASTYLHSLSQDPDVCYILYPTFLRLGKRILNERSMSDARWQWFESQRPSAPSRFPNLASSDLEGPHGFQFVSRAPTSSSDAGGAGGDAPILPSAFLLAKLDTLHGLNEFWLLTHHVLAQFHDADMVIEPRQFLALTEIPLRLATVVQLPSGEDEVVCSDSAHPSQSTFRRMFKEDETGNPHSALGRPYEDQPDVESFPNSKFACLCPELGEDVLEECASRLLRSVDLDSALRASEDGPMDDLGSSAQTHVLCGLHLAGELVEFARVIQTKLAKESQSHLQSIFDQVALGAGFTPTTLNVIKSQDTVLQTVSLIPTLVSSLCDAVNTRLKTASQSQHQQHQTNTLMNYEMDQSGFKPNSETDQAMDLLIRVGRLVVSGLAEVVRYRSNHLPTLAKMLSSELDHNLSPKSIQLPCWITDIRPFGVGDSLIDLFETLVKSASDEWFINPDPTLTRNTSLHQFMNDTASLAIELAQNLLDLAKQRIQWLTSQSMWAWSQSDLDDLSTSRLSAPSVKHRLQVVQRLRRLRHWFVGVRKYLISSVGDRLRRPEFALSLAEQFSDRDQIVRWCYLLELQDEAHETAGGGCAADPLDRPSSGLLVGYTLDDGSDAAVTNRFHHHRLATILQRVPPELKLADFALQWYLSHEERSRVQSLLALLHQINKSPHEAIEHLQPPNGSEHAEQADIKDSFLCPSGPKSRPDLNRSTRSHPVANSDAVFVKPQSMSSLLRATGNQNQGQSSTQDPVQRFLHRMDVRDYAWPHLLSTGQNDKAAEILLDQACKEFRFLGRRKTLFGLAKLAFLASDQWDASPHATPTHNLHRMSNDSSRFRKSGTGHNHPFLVRIDRYLEWIQYQELLSSELLNHSGTSSLEHDEDPRLQRVLSLTKLARLYVHSSARPEDEDQDDVSSHPRQTDVDMEHGAEDDTKRQSGDAEFKSQSRLAALTDFRRAFGLANLLQDLGDLRPDECNVASSWTDVRADLILYIWCQAIKMDRWSTSGKIHDPVEICTRSFICALVMDLLQHGINAIELLPTSEQILTAKELGDLVLDHQFRYLIESGFEYMHTLLPGSQAQISNSSVDDCILIHT